MSFNFSLKQVTLWQVCRVHEYQVNHKIFCCTGADFSVGDDSGYTPMHGAAFQGHSDIVMTLINFGVPFLKEYHIDG